MTAVGVAVGRESAHHPNQAGGVLGYEQALLISLRRRNGPLQPHLRRPCQFSLVRRAEGVRIRVQGTQAYLTQRRTVVRPDPSHRCHLAERKAENEYPLLMVRVGGDGDAGVMERGLDELPEVYARYFDLRREGMGVAEIARELELPEAAMDSFIELAHAKLAGVERTHRRPHSSDHE